MPDAASPQTIRGHLEASISLREKSIERLLRSAGPRERAFADQCRQMFDALHLHGVAALDLLDNAVQFADVTASSVHTSEVFRQVYDPPAPRGDAESNDDKIRKLYGPGTQGSVS